MFTISPGGFAAFEHDAETRFIVRLSALLRDAVPSLANAPEPDFGAQLRLLVADARRHGLVSERAIGNYAVSAGLLGLDFADRFPGVQQILHGLESGDRKGELLEAFTLNLLETLER